MNKVLKVKMSSYKRKTDDDFNFFATTLLENGKDPDFDLVRYKLVTLEEQASDFTTKLLKSKNNGKVESDAKNAAREELTLTIDEYAHLINSLAVRNPSIIAKSGFDSQESSHTRSYSEADLAPPHSLNVKLIPNTRNVKLTFVISKKRPRDLYRYQWSEDNGVTWNDGTSTSRRQFIIKDLPIRKDLLLRVQILASDGKPVSVSAAIACFVP